MLREQQPAGISAHRMSVRVDAERCSVPGAVTAQAVSAEAHAPDADELAQREGSDARRLDVDDAAAVVCVER
jgi:hypothetical protein